jgi:DNA polymerase I
MSDTQPYVHATTADQATAWLADASGIAMVGVDTETTGWDPHADRLRLIQVAATQRPTLVLDAQQVDPAVLGPLLGDRAVLKVFHHGSFDLRFLATSGVGVHRVADTMLAQQLLDGGEKTAAGVGLAGIASYRLGVTLDKSVRETFADGGPITAEQIRYAADDAAATLAVFEQQWRELVGHGLTRIAQLEFGALPVMAAMQLRGVPFDAVRWKTELEALEAELPALEETVQQALVSETSPRTLFGPEPVNLESHEQVLAALARLGLELPSTRESLLRDHAEHPAVGALLKYRQVSKITSNWGGDWADRVVHPMTGRVHADWRQIVGTGRIACSDPNLTQVPKEARYRACFGGEDGRLLVVADYSQQELRILAAVSGDEALAEVFRQGGDLHRTTAAMAFKVAEDMVTGEQRAAAKALNFGLMYGMGSAGFARSTGMTLTDAQAAMDAYFSAFPNVAQYLADAEAGGRRTGRVRTPLGRIRTLDPAAGSIVTLARNAPIQGAGADMTKLALAAVEQRLAERFGDRVARPDGLVLVVHDELVADVPAEAAHEAAGLVTEGMQAAAAEILGDIPAAVDVSVQPRWGETG